MLNFYYKKIEPDDFEEATEENCLFESTKKIIPDITLIHDTKEIQTEENNSVMFGRLSKLDLYKENKLFYPKNELKIPYWQDKTVLQHMNREFYLADFEEAQILTKELHSKDKDVFLKSVRDKFYITKIPKNNTFQQIVGDMAYSFCDLDYKCLMVQEFAKIEHEYRMFIINKQVVTGAGTIDRMTPLDNNNVFDLKTEKIRNKSKNTEESEQRIQKYINFSQEIVKTIDFNCYTLDIAEINNEIGIIELNPLILGNTGLYACNTDKLAEATINYIFDIYNNSFKNSIKI